MVVSDFLSFHVSPDPSGANPGAQPGSKALRLRPRAAPAHGGAAATARQGPPGRGQVPGTAPGCGTAAGRLRPPGLGACLARPHRASQLFLRISLGEGLRVGGMPGAAHAVRPRTRPASPALLSVRARGFQCSPPRAPAGHAGASGFTARRPRWGWFCVRVLAARTAPLRGQSAGEEEEEEKATRGCGRASGSRLLSPARGAFPRGTELRPHFGAAVAFPCPWWSVGPGAGPSPGQGELLEDGQLLTDKLPCASAVCKH